MKKIELDKKINDLQKELNKRESKLTMLKTVFTLDLNNVQELKSYNNKFNQLEKEKKEIEAEITSLSHNSNILAYLNYKYNSVFSFISAFYQQFAKKCRAWYSSLSENAEDSSIMRFFFSLQNYLSMSIHK